MRDRDWGNVRGWSERLFFGKHERIEREKEMEKREKMEWETETGET